MRPVTIKQMDRRFLEWLKRKPSAHSGQFSEWHNGDGFSIPAHYRNAANAGTGFKPPFSAIPLTDSEHKLTHQHGNSALRPDDWWRQKVIEYRERWLRTQPPEIVEMVRAMF